MKPDEMEKAKAHYKDFGDLLKGAQALERHFYNVKEKSTLTINNFYRFPPGFRDRLAAFFDEELNKQMERIKDYKPNHEPKQR